MTIPNELKIKMVRAQRDGTLIPSPAVVYPKPFKVLPPPPGAAGSVAVDTKDGKKLDVPLFGVPLTDSDRDRAVRAHEYAHLAVEQEYPNLPRTLCNELPNSWMNAGLDNIVNAYARQSGVTDVNNLPLPMCDEYREPQALGLLQSMSTVVNPIAFKPNPKVTSLLDAADKKVITRGSVKLQQIGAALRSKEITETDAIDQSLAVLRGLQKYFEDDEQEQPKEGQSTPKAGETLPGEQAMKNTIRHLADYDEYTTDTVPDWMDLFHEKVTLDRKMPRDLAAPKHTAGMVGAFRNPVRALLPAFDGMAWDRKKKLQGGTILLDMSGSMRVTSEMVLELLKTAPLATIAGYSGQSDNRCPLWILAEKGRYCSEVPNPDGSNGADGPALRWLGKQEYPRIWISDGHVTGKYDQQHVALVAECLRICKRYGIARVHNIDEYLSLCGKR